MDIWYHYRRIIRVVNIGQIKIPLILIIRRQIVALAAAAAVAAVAVVMATATVAAVLTTASAAVMVLGLELLGRGVAHELDVASIAHGLTGQLVVEVHGDLVVGDLGDNALDAHSLLGHHGHDGTHADVLVVKLAVNVEDFLLEFINHVGVLDTEGLLGLQGEVKLLSLLQVDDVVLEALDEGDIHTEDKGIGMLLVELEDTHLLVAIDNENLVHEFDVLTCLNFLH